MGRGALLVHLKQHQLCPLQMVELRDHLPHLPLELLPLRRQQALLMEVSLLRKQPEHLLRHQAPNPSQRRTRQGQHHPLLPKLQEARLQRARLQGLLFKHHLRSHLYQLMV